MWLFITSRIRTWLLFAVLVPLLTSLVHLVRVRLEARDPDSQVVRALRTVERFGDRTHRRRTGGTAER